MTVGQWLASARAAGEHDFLLVPFFISPQGAIGSALHEDLVQYQRTIGPFRFAMAAGLATRGVLPEIVADRIREAMHVHGLRRPGVIVVDHGGPSLASPNCATILRLPGVSGSGPKSV